MRESGYSDRQWLVQRDGRFIQLTELLYRVVEQANGERTLEEIAARVTEKTDWIVSADNVRQLLRTKLIPLGLIVPAAGTVVSRYEGRMRSPLALNVRAKVIGPQVIDPIAGVLQVLFAPPILIPTLILIALGHWWLYFVHGVGGSIRDALYTPGLLLVVLAVLVASVAVHEFGHASALRYGGGKVRGMGVGIYLIYPVFYTDTTDSYRLGRWARVRTDLGGFYFHLIFALGIIGLYMISGHEFLLLVVLLINLDIIRQNIPFVRFDGYWALADITGVPDFLSQTGPFLRSVLPIPGSKGSKLPNLKPWVKVVFAAYVLLTIPVLSFLLFLLVTRLPYFAAIIWESLLIQTQGLFDAQSNGDLWGIVVSAVQILILALPVVGITYLLYMLVWSLIRVIRNQPTLARRIIGTLVAGGVVALVVFLWIS